MTRHPEFRLLPESILPHGGMRTRVRPLPRKWASLPLGRRWRSSRSNGRKAGISAPILQTRAPEPG